MSLKFLLAIVFEFVSVCCPSHTHYFTFSYVVIGVVVVILFESKKKKKNKKSAKKRLRKQTNKRKKMANEILKPRLTEMTHNHTKFKAKDKRHVFK